MSREFKVTSFSEDWHAVQYKDPDMSTWRIEDMDCKHSYKTRKWAEKAMIKAKLTHKEREKAWNRNRFDFKGSENASD